MITWKWYPNIPSDLPSWHVESQGQNLEGGTWYCWFRTRVHLWSPWPFRWDLRSNIIKIADHHCHVCGPTIINNQSINQWWLMITWEIWDLFQRFEIFLRDSRSIWDPFERFVVFVIHLSFEHFPFCGWWRKDKDIYWGSLDHFPPSDQGSHPPFDRGLLIFKSPI